MRTQTKIRNRKILGHVFNLLFFIAVVYVMTLCYDKFQADSLRAKGILTPTENAQFSSAFKDYVQAKSKAQSENRSIVIDDLKPSTIDFLKLTEPENQSSAKSGGSAK